MVTLVYTKPSGDDLQSPTPEQVLNDLRQDDGYRQGYSPVGVLCWHEHPESPPPSVALGTATQRQQLLFIRHPKQGWYFEYSTTNLVDRRWLVPLDPAAEPNRFVRQWAFGEQVHLFIGSFVPQTLAERIIADFLNTREPSPAVAWVAFNSVSPRLSPDDYRERRKQTRAESPTADRP